MLSQPSPEPEANAAGGEGPRDAVHGETAVRVRSLDYWMREYNYPPPDEFVGPESGRYLLDYGRAPIVVADSSRGARRTWLEQLLRRHVLKRH